jgi:2-iminobutanoate/2-iminopropanoate deaminase
MRRTDLLAAALLLAGGIHAQAPRFVQMPGGANYPFSAAVVVGQTIFLSGQIGADSTGKLAPGGIGAETKQALENISSLLKSLGASMDDVVKCTVMLTDIKEWGAMNDVYRTFFTKHPPARSAFATNGLALGARVGIECLAQLPGASPR